MIRAILVAAAWALLTCPVSAEGDDDEKKSGQGRVGEALLLPRRFSPPSTACSGRITREHEESGTETERMHRRTEAT